jgi:hypothetical protein
MPHNISWVNELICSDCHLTTHGLCSTQSIGIGSVMATVGKPGYSKGGEDFLSEAVMGDET